MFNIKELVTLAEQPADSASLRKGDSFGHGFIGEGDYRIKVYHDGQLSYEHSIEVIDDNKAPKQVLINISEILKPGDPTDTLKQVRTNGVVVWWLSSDSQGVYIIGQKHIPPESDTTPETFDSRKLQKNEFYRHTFIAPGKYKIKNAEGTAEGTITVKPANSSRSRNEYRELITVNKTILCTDKGFSEKRTEILSLQAVVWFTSEKQAYRILITPELLAD